MKGFSLDQNTTNINETYTKVNKPNRRVISDHATFPKSKFN